MEGCSVVAVCLSDENLSSGYRWWCGYVRYGCMISTVMRVVEVLNDTIDHLVQ